MIVKNNDLRLVGIGEVKLLPGNNQVDSKLWEQLKKDYNLESLFKDSKLEEISFKTKKGEKEVEKEFKDFEIKDKEEIIKNTFSLKTLEIWRMTETDVAIRVQIEDRIKGITDKKIKENYGKPKNHV